MFGVTTSRAESRFFGFFREGEDPADLRDGGVTREGGMGLGEGEGGLAFMAGDV